MGSIKFNATFTAEDISGVFITGRTVQQAGLFRVEIEGHGPIAGATIYGTGGSPGEACHHAYAQLCWALDEAAKKGKVFKSALDEP